MRSTARILSQASRSRAKSISFVGLGRMGSEMAYNLFSKRVAESSDFRFVVFDKVPEAAARFTDDFRKQFKAANITAANDLEECVSADGIVFLHLK
jgi:3-hydroxyisobutyrate dehydrogenase